MGMLYLDWSGDAGFKFHAGSSRFVTLACVHQAESLANGLHPLRQQYRLAQDFHFRFAQVSQVIKRPFFQWVSELNVAGRVLRADKQRLSHELRRLRGDALVAMLIAETVSALPSVMLDDSTLLIDGNRKETAFTQTIRVALSSRLRTMSEARLRVVKFRPAQEEDGLQIADMLAGAAASQHLSDHALLGLLGNKVDLVDWEK